MWLEFSQQMGRRIPYVWGSRRVFGDLQLNWDLKSDFVRNKRPGMYLTWPVTFAFDLPVMI